MDITDFVIALLVLFGLLMLITNIEMNDLKGTVSKLLTPDGKINDEHWYISDEKMLNPILKQQILATRNSGIVAQRQREIELNPPMFTSIGDKTISQTTGTMNNIEDPLQTIGKTDIYDNTEIEDKADIVESNRFTDEVSYYDMTDEIDTIPIHTSSITGNQQNIS